MKHHLYYSHSASLLMLLLILVQPLKAIPLVCVDTYQGDDPVSRTYVHASSLDAATAPRIGASSWKFDRRQGRAIEGYESSASVTITYEDFLVHLGLDRTRIIQIAEPINGGIPMDVGEEDVTGATWTMPDISNFGGYSISSTYPRDTAAVPDFQYFPYATHVFDRGNENYNFLELVPDIDGYTGYLDNQGYTDALYIYEVYSTLTPIPMALGLGVFEGEFGPEPCEFFEDGCDSGPEEDHFTMTQTYEEVASGTFNTYDDGMADALKLRNTDSITVFDVDSNVINVIVIDYIVWYTKEGHLVKGLLEEDAPWTGNTTFEYLEYHKLSPVVSSLVTQNADNEKVVVVYPNPGSSDVYFSRPAAYELFDLDGRLLASGQAEQQVDVSNLPTGTYLVRIDGGKAFRWMKQ